MTLSRKTAKNEALPKGWRRVTLGEFGTFYKGKGITKADLVKDGIPCLRYAEIYTKYDGIVNELSSSVSPGAATKATPIQSGDIIFAASGETAAEIGKAIAFVGCYPAVAGGDTVIFRDHGQEPTYLAHMLNSADAARQKARLGKGQSVVHIHVPELFQVEVPLPPLHEQRKIAEILATWDTAIEKTEALIAAKEKQFKWLLRTLISDKHDNPRWREVKLGDVCEKIVGGGTPSTENPDYWQGHIPWITSADIVSYKTIKYRKYITDQALDNSATNLIPKNNIIVVTRVSLGKAVRNDIDVCISQDSQGLILKKIIYPDFLINFLIEKIKIFKSTSQGSTIKGITKRQLADIKIPLPSLTEQKVIASLLEKAQEEIDILKQLAEQYRTQKRGLMQKLLTGRWLLK